MAKTTKAANTAKNAGSKTQTPRASISTRWRSVAESRCESLGERLTPARLGAYAELIAAKGALTAYELIDRLGKRQKRDIAPLTVYRHLDFLTRVGLVHRIESTQSYLPCEHPEKPHDSQYLLCSDCGRIEEVRSDSLDSLLTGIASKRGFKPAKTIVEVSGMCGECAGGQRQKSPVSMT
ncbi:MAG: Fur family transcriptional regulator [Pseudomonadota bacterium]